jgi:peptidoglycan/xylan/chitin deacetylase (PgdA/CDA1 family)
MDGRRDGVAHGARVRRLDRAFRWPGGRSLAVVFNVAFEGWSEGHAPGIGPMGNPLPPGSFDTNATSWGAYGAERGMDRLLRLLDAAGLRASVMVSGCLAERDSQLVRAIAAAGHEIVAHSHAQEIVPARLTAEEDRANIARTSESLTAASGVRPAGWISPRGTPGADTARHLMEAGYAWHGDAFDDDRPYLQIFASGSIVAIPLTMEINDLPHAMRFGRSPRQFVEQFDDALVHMLAAGDEATMIDVTAHAHVYGRPAGAWAVAAIAHRMRDMSEVYVATRGEIAAHVREALG